MGTLDDEADGPDEEIELIRPEDFLPVSPFPQDAQRLGVDRYTGAEGAWIGLAASLDSTRLSHRLFAIALLVLFVGSFALTLWGQLSWAWR